MGMGREIVTEWDLTGDYDPPIAPDEEADMDTDGMGPDEDEPDAVA